MPRDKSDNIIIILVGTKHPGNIGSVARAMQNMGLKHLRLAAAQCTINEESGRMARKGAEILAAAGMYRSLRTALRGLRWVVGTTAKTGGYRRQAHDPHSLAPRILAHAQSQKVGIVFGAEDTGLVDDDLLLCQALMRIPTHPRARSINLAQAVMIVSYELYLARRTRAPARAPKLASVDVIEAMYSQFERALHEIDFLHDKNARHMMFRFRQLFGRTGLEPADVAILRGLARQISWLGARHPS